MKFLDSNVIAYSFYSNEYREKCQEAIKEGGITDTLALTEAFYIIEKIIDRKTAKESIKGVLKSDVHIVDLDINVIFQALKRVDKYNLSIFDMNHFISALLNNCTIILSYDKDFNNLDIPREEP